MAKAYWWRLQVESTVALLNAKRLSPPAAWNAFRGWGLRTEVANQITVLTCRARIPENSAFSREEPINERST